MYNPLLMIDFYKAVHAEMLPQGITKSVSYFTPRMSRVDRWDKVVNFVLQAFIKTYLIDYFRDEFFDKSFDEAVGEYKRIMDAALGIDAYKIEKIEKISFFKKVWYSITKFEQYPNMAMEGLKRAIKYLAILTAILALWVIPCLQGSFVLSASEKSLKLKTVVIDPGHGGHDPGGISTDRKTYEKTLTLDIAKRLGEKIKAKFPGVKVVYTRTTDVYVTLSDRAAIANRNNADLFISVHTNASPSTSAHGTSVHVLGQSSRPDRDLYAGNLNVCKRENSVMLLEEDYTTAYQGFDPNSPESFIFFNLMTSSHFENSIVFAENVEKQMRTSRFAISGYTGIHQDPFWVLWRTSMPAVLLELGFITNPGDAALMRDNPSLFAEGIYRGIREYTGVE